jgi:GNAT superfamily N-acetyltransferase
MEIEYLADHRLFAATLAQWHYDEWGQRFREHDSVELRTEGLLAAANRRVVPTVFVALEQGELLGSAMLAVSDMETRRDLSPWLADVFVKPSARRRGIASALTRRVVHEAAELKIPRLYLFTTGPMREGLYARLGWVVEGRPEYQGVERVLMSIRPGSSN